MIPKLIKTEQEYESALMRIDELMDAEANTPECDELELLGLLIQDYDEKHYKLPEPRPEDITQFNIEQRGIKK